MVWSELLAQFQTWAQSLVTSWGYPGIFLVSFLGNASIIFPIPAFLVVFTFGGILNPWVLGTVAGIGAALGEITGYALGWGGRKGLKKKYGPWLNRAKEWFHKLGMFPIIVIFASTPLPDDVVGILGGMVKYNLKKFLLAALIGKIILHIAIAWAGFYGSWMVGGFWNVVTLVVVVMFALFLYNVFRFLERHLRER